MNREGKLLNMKKAQYQYQKGLPQPLGVTRCGDDYNFAISLQRDCQCVLLIYHCGEKKAFLQIPVTKEYATGTIYSVRILNLKETEFEYSYLVDDQPLIDPYSTALTGRNKWGAGTVSGTETVHSRVSCSMYHWEQDQLPKHSLENVMMYSLHVRGFTKHASSGVKAKGTYQGVIEKIPYFKELGVNQIELLPAYDFYETADEEESCHYDHPFRNHASVYETAEKDKAQRVNYWGFTDGFYFTPKASYAYGVDPVSEYKDMVKALHKEGIELIMQFYFPEGINRNLILDCICYWVLEYHIDGVHLQGTNLPVTLIATNPLLADTKIYYYDFDTENIRKETRLGDSKNLAVYRQEYADDMRRYLKSDEDMLKAFTYHMRHVPKETGIIHYISQYEGFTLYDLVSYDCKHNEANGEDNKDGNSYNYSWNCGYEGLTRKKAILELRKKQMKNALTFLLLSQGTPMIYAGDEWANSQLGNNNPYCQDNAVAWTEWKQNRFSKEVYEFTKNMISFRREHPILHQPDELRIMDYISCGYPDLSYHGESAWYPKFDNHIRHIGMMFCGKYAKINHSQEDSFLYAAFNMHWDTHAFGLPKLPKNMKWYLKVDTGAKNGRDFYKDQEEILLKNQDQLTVSERSTIVLIAL
ncbi:MAG: hypothetical protein Q4G60_00400 [bacterium]|nr:hypothetical protein [bacterium]